MTSFASTNTAKASFDEVYNAPTPHAYFAEMRTLGYQIGEQARRYCIAAATLLDRYDHVWPIQMLDVGCSYGVGSAFVKYGCSFEELVSFYESRAPREPTRCAEATRAWLNVVPPELDMRVVGLDVSERAIRFATEAALLDAGVSRDLEDESLSSEERALIRGCNMLVCTGAVGYVGASTFTQLLPLLGEDHPTRFGPVAVLTILRMFDSSEIRAAFQKAGWELEQVEGVRLPQRAFADEVEQKSILERVRQRGLDPTGWETNGVLYADLYAGARATDQIELVSALEAVARSEPLFRPQVEVATARELRSKDGSSSM